MYIYIYRAFRSIHFETSIRSDPIRSKKCFDPVRSNEKVLDPIRSDPTQASKKKSSIRSKYFKIISIRSNYLYLFNDLIKVLNFMFNQIQLEFYITLLQSNIISNYFRCIFLSCFCLIMIKNSVYNEFASVNTTDRLKFISGFQGMIIFSAPQGV